MQISFKAYIPKTIPPIYTTDASRKNTVAILGSSKTTPDIMEYMKICADYTKNLILSGKNIVSGCGTAGIMGAAYNTAKEFSSKNEEGKPRQNLTIITNHLWGDEDLENCIPLTATNSEAERTEKFAEVADTIVIFPGGATTLQEATTLITKNHYGKKENMKNIILVGKNFFKGLIEQYQKLYESKLLKYKPEELFTVIDK